MDPIAVDEPKLELQPLSELTNAAVNEPKPKKEMTEHQRKSTELGQFPCTHEGCNFVAKTALGLAKHVASKHTVKCSVEDRAPQIPTAQAAASPDPIDNDLKDKQEIVNQLRLLDKKFGAKIGWKNHMTVDHTLAKLENERQYAVGLIEQRCGVDVAFNVLINLSKVCEVATSHPTVNRFVDLEGLSEAYSQEQVSQDIKQALEEVLATYPNINKVISPEMKLVMLLTSGAVQVANQNAKSKKNS